VVAAVEADAFGGQGGQDLLVEQLVLARHQVVGELRHLLVDLLGGEAVHPRVLRIEPHLLLEAGDPDLEELVHVAGGDAQEAQAFQ